MNTETMSQTMPNSTIAADEVAKFARMADSWWDPSGDFRPLHKFNPERIRFVRDRLAAHFGRDPEQSRPFAGLKLLDVGCGGGLIAEPMARLGFEVMAIDATPENIAVARLHAARMDLPIRYEVSAPESLRAAGMEFDAVLALEVVEHVSDVSAFLGAVGGLVTPGGAAVVATLNRTLKAFLLAKVGAEYVLRWLPAGTHDWRKFVRPSEMAAGLRRGGLVLNELAGMSYDIATDSWKLGRDIDVNYMAFAVKA
jgi:2-polyprenyl-6-hydroxyphenyl methylase/3-demethylubiquinone-9 3-methyltransferase